MFLRSQFPPEVPHGRKHDRPAEFVAFVALVVCVLAAIVLRR